MLAPSTSVSPAKSAEDDSNDTIGAPRRAGATWADAWQTSGLFAVLVCLVLLRPIRLVATHSLTSADLLQTSSIWNVEPAYEPENPLLGDPVAQFQPWLAFDARELARGVVPLWNPLNAGGLPQLANYQSAVFSPFSLPGYLLGPKLGALVSTWLQLFVLGVFGALFLRELGLRRLAAWLGGVVFAFNGFTATCASYPHVGVFALMPVLLFTLERAFRGVRERGRVSFGACVALAIEAALAAYAGHPETLFFVACVVTGWALLRLLLDRRELAERRATLRLSCALVSSAFAAVMLAAPQLLPFLEYLPRSSVFGSHRLESMHVAVDNLPLLCFPDLAGAPRAGELVQATLPTPVYEEVVANSPGALALWCALLAWLFARRDPRQWFVGCLALVWVPYAYDLGGFGGAMRALPVFELVPAARSQPVWIPALAISAALALDGLLSAASRGLGSRLVRSGAVVAVALAFAAVCEWAARRYSASIADALAAAQPTARAAIEAHRVAVLSSFALGAAAVAASLLVASPKLRATLACVLIAAVFFQSGWSLRGVVPTVEDRLVFPITEAGRTLREHVGADTLESTPFGGLLPHTNMTLGVRLLSSYDGLELRAYEDLRTVFLGHGAKAHTATRPTIKGLVLFGASYLLCERSWMPADGELARARVVKSNHEYLTEPVTTAAPLHASFVAADDRLQGVLLRVAKAPDPRCSVRVTLRDDTGAGIAQRVARLDQLDFIGGGRRNLPLTFPPVERAFGRRFELDVEIVESDGLPGPTFLAAEDWDRLRVRDVQRRQRLGRAFTEPAALDQLDRLRQGERELPGGLWLDFAYVADRFTTVAELGTARLHRLKGAPGRAWLVPGAEFVADERAAFERVVAPDFDPRSSVVLIDPQASAPVVKHAGRRKLESRTSESQHSSWATSTAAPAWLVVAQSDYPGWHARVDGQPAPRLRANYALTAVAVPPGEHVVELVYEPRSFALGCLLAATAIVGFAGAGLIVSRRRAAARARAVAA
ncbi:MAG: YfhO family protein [Planctomycetes bacterium]|nr:YfhO family protein [Planctomycetota bacterium]